MPLHFWLFTVGIILLVAFVEFKLRRGLAMPKIPQPFNINIKLMGGPFDGQEHEIEVLKRPAFFIQPYLPEDPPEEQKIATVENYKDGEPVGRQEMYAPSWAYYQLVLDDTYFYVRNVTEEEVTEIATTGKLPDVRPTGTS
jgi:hypothetical protein